MNSPSTDPERMTRTEREDLRKLAHDRGRVAKNRVDALVAERLADHEREMAAIYDFDDDEVWKTAMLEADSIRKEAEAKLVAAIAARCDSLGIPTAYQPTASIDVNWYGRGQNLSASRRAEMRAVVKTRLDAMAKEAKSRIDNDVLEIRTELLADGLSTETAKAALDRIPDVEALMPPFHVTELKGLMPPPKLSRYYSRDPSRYITDRSISALLEAGDDEDDE